MVGQTRTAAERDRELDELEATWADRPGLAGWIATLDHKRVARRYIVTALVFFVLAGLLAMLMRTQLSAANSHVLGPDRYNQFFSMHGTTMVFLFALPTMEAVAVYMVPLMVGARAIAFPQLNAFSYWTYLFGGALALLAFTLDIGLEAGWPGSMPLSGAEYSAGNRSGFPALTIALSGVAALCIAVEIIATSLAMRAPGMRLSRIPLYVWSMLVASLMLIFALLLVLLDSYRVGGLPAGTRVFTAAEGVDMLPWQHLLQPAMCIVLMPALGMVSSIVETFSRRAIVGYAPMVLALFAIGFLSFAPWMQRTFAAPLPPGNSLLAVADMAIAIPGAVLVYCWIATLWTGRPRDEHNRIPVPLLFVLGFFALFLLGGLSAVALSVAPLERQLHETYFAVANLHYLLVGGAVFPLMGALYYWFPKFTGKMLSETIGRVQFWLFFLGANVTFFPMYVLGLTGMPRRVYTYPSGLGWELSNTIASLGAWMIAAGVAVFAFNVYYALKQGRPAGDNPWGAPDLSWATRSPPPAYNFENAPVVGGREPLWPLGGPLQVMTGLARDRREAQLTTPIDAAPTARWVMPNPSPWPLWAAMAVTALFICAASSLWGVACGAILIGIASIAWFSPRRSDRNGRNAA